MEEIKKVELESLKFSDARVRTSLYRIQDKLSEIIEWINKEERHRSRAKRLL